MTPTSATKPSLDAPRTTRRGFSPRSILLLTIAAAFLLIPVSEATANQLSVNIAGSGSGEVSSVGGLEATAFGGGGNVFEGEPAIECHYDGTAQSGVCVDTMQYNEEFLFGIESTALHAVPASGSEFSGWKLEGSTGPIGCEESRGAETWSEFGTCVPVAEGRDVMVTASFEECAEGSEAPTCESPPAEELLLTVLRTGTGNGAVTSTPAGINCGTICTHKFEEGTSVELHESAGTGSDFVEWTGGCTGSGGCTVAMSAAKSVGAVFDRAPPAKFTLTIIKAGTGQGAVTCDDGSCASSYEVGATVSLAASAASGSTFVGWSGGGCSGNKRCVVTIRADTTVTATFDADPPYEEARGTVKAAGSASVSAGRVSLELSCTGGPCKGTIQLTAKVKQGKKTKSLVIGKASFSIAEGATATVKVKLSGPAKSELAKGKTVKAKTSGTGVSPSTVKLKQARTGG